MRKQPPQLPARVVRPRDSQLSSPGAYTPLLTSKWLVAGSDQTRMPHAAEDSAHAVRYHDKVHTVWNGKLLYQAFSDS
eukprot:3306338-Pyramimonas_sp.AAC.1